MARQASSRRAAAGSSDRQDARRNGQVGSRTGRSRALLPRRDRKYTRTARGKRITSPASSARAPAPRPTVATHWPARSRSPVAAGSPPSSPPARCRPRPPGPTSMLDLPDSRSALPGSPSSAGPTHSELTYPRAEAAATARSTVRSGRGSLPTCLQRAHLSQAGHCQPICNQAASAPPTCCQPICNEPCLWACNATGGVRVAAAPPERGVLFISVMER